MSSAVEAVGDLVGGLLGVKDPVIPELPEPVAPEAPIEEAGLEIEDEESRKKAKSGKGQFKIPLSATTGQTTPQTPSQSGSVSGLKV